MSALYGVLGFIFFVIEMVSYQIGFYFADLWYDKVTIYKSGAANCHKFAGDMCADYQWHMLFFGFGIFWVDFILLLIFSIYFHKTRKAKPGFIMLFAYVIPSILFHLNIANGLELANLAGIFFDVSLIVAALIVVRIYRYVEKRSQKAKMPSVENKN